MTAAVIGLGAIVLAALTIVSVANRDCEWWEFNFRRDGLTVRVCRHPRATDHPEVTASAGSKLGSAGNAAGGPEDTLGKEPTQSFGGS